MKLFSCPHLAACIMAGLLSAGLLSCTEAETLLLHAVPNQQVQVGSELTVEMVVSNAAGGAPRFSVRSPSIADLNERSTPPQFIPFGSTGAYLKWTPLARDVGDHIFRVEAGTASQATGVNFRVRVLAGSAAPVFLKPLGSGKTVNMDESNCINFEVIVQDTDTARVAIFLEAPIEDGYQFIDNGDNTGSFDWCPSVDQMQRASRYSVNFAADDGDGHVTRKPFSLLLRQAVGMDCPGRAPTIEHQPPRDTNGVIQVELTARIADDIGIGMPMPRVHYSLVPPANLAERELDTLSVVDMERQSGTERDGLYVATVPLEIPPDHPDPSNPQLFYFIEVTDNDDPGGNCDHRVSQPRSGYINVSVSPPSDGTPAQACLPCQADSACGSGLCVDLGDGQPVCLPRCGAGGPGNGNCDGVGSAGCCDGSFLLVCSGTNVQTFDCGSEDSCGWSATEGAYSCSPTQPSDPVGRFPRACGDPGGAGCPQGFSCSGGALTSVNGSADVVCRPDNGSCLQDCIDDAYEQNDSQAEVMAPIQANQTVTDLRLCGVGDGVDRDYFGVFLDAGRTLVVEALFRHEDGDLDLSLLDNVGQAIQASYSYDDNERIEACLEPGFYYIHAWSINRRISLDYELSLSTPDQACCVDDVGEDDDGPNQAQVVEVGEAVGNRVICPGDEDWYAIELNANDQVVAEMIFDHESATDDLDVFLYDTDGITELTPCCDIENGQSGDSDERLEYTVPRAGIYYFAVIGYRGASNDYMIGFEVQPN